jgi:hypothetical protein
MFLDIHLLFLSLCHRFVGFGNVGGDERVLRIRCRERAPPFVFVQLRVIGPRGRGYVAKTLGFVSCFDYCSMVLFGWLACLGVGGYYDLT